MRLLLDTHAAIWAVEGDPRLSSRARELMENVDNELWLSMASVWEMSIKQGLGKLGLRSGVAKTATVVQGRGVRLLSIELSHVLAVQSLPPHHGDPFDASLLPKRRSKG